jgi:3-hydroxyacyl-CoA dehydrogenase
MFWADSVGLANVVERLRAYEKQYGAAWKPAALLLKLAEQGKSFTR